MQTAPRSGSKALLLNAVGSNQQIRCSVIGESGDAAKPRNLFNVRWALAGAVAYARNRNVP